MEEIYNYISLKTHNKFFYNTEIDKHFYEFNRISKKMLNNLFGDYLKEFIDKVYSYAIPITHILERQDVKDFLVDDYKFSHFITIGRFVIQNNYSEFSSGCQFPSIVTTINNIKYTHTFSVGQENNRVYVDVSVCINKIKWEELRNQHVKDASDFIFNITDKILGKNLENINLKKLQDIMDSVVYGIFTCIDINCNMSSSYSRIILKKYPDYDDNKQNLNNYCYDLIDKNIERYVWRVDNYIQKNLKHQRKHNMRFIFRLYRYTNEIEIGYGFCQM